jgi:hypothetical protein
MGIKMLESLNELIKSERKGRDISENPGPGCRSV